MGVWRVLMEILMINKSYQRYVLIFLWATAFWVTVGVLHLGSLYVEEIQSSHAPFPSKERWALFVLTHFTWAFLTTFVYFLIERSPPRSDSIRWLIWLVLTAVFWVIFTAVSRQSLISFLWGESYGNLEHILLNESPFLYLFNFLKVILAYGACTGIFYYLQARDAQLKLLALGREAAAVREQQARFQLKALQSQLSPHFLFNCLNSVSGLARNNDTARIVETLARLADILRYAIEGAEKEQVILADELAFTESYIFLQQLRFNGCFDYTLQNLLSNQFAFCPPFCVQTLVENVFSHNELSPSNPVSINVRVTGGDGVLRVSVENTPLLRTPTEGIGVGLDNLKGRLRLLYGDGASLSTFEDSDKFVATLTLPVIREDD
jgi:sensor histidine kinase YesM